LKIPAGLAGSGDLIKQGTGTLSLSGANTFTGRFVVEDGRLQPEIDAALGPEPANYKADAIVLKGGILGSTETTYGKTVISPKRGITIDAAGEIGVRSEGLLRIQSPIVGSGDLRISYQSGTLRLEAPCSYTGRTELGYKGLYSTGNQCLLELGCENALPATTCLSAASKGSLITSTVSVEGTVQRTAGISTSGNVHLILSGAGTIRFGTDADAALAISNTYLTAGITLAYAGGGAVTPMLTTAAGTMFSLEHGTLAMTATAKLGPSSVMLCAGTTASFAAGASALEGSLVLAGDATIAAVEPLTLGGDLVRAEGVAAAGLTLANGTAVTLGKTDNRLRRFDVNVSPETGLTLDGWIFAETDPAAFTQTKECVVFGPHAAPGTVEEKTFFVDAQMIGLTSIDALGAGIDTLRVRNGGFVAFHTEGTETFVPTLDVAETSVVALGGTGTFDLSGTEVSGAGTIRLAGARVVAKGDLRGVTVEGVSGELNVSEGETVTVGPVTGALRKTGLGTLVFAGAEANNCSLVVAEGTVRLASTSVAVLKDVTVDAGARLLLDADEQIGDNAVLRLNGTFDLNGHTETLQRFHNTTAVGFLRDGSDAALINSSASPATIRTVEENAFYGRITREPGDILMESESGMQSLLGAADAIAPTTIRAKGDASVIPYTGWSEVRFVLHSARVRGTRLSLSEIQLTLDGVPIPLENVNSVNVVGTSLANNGLVLRDGRADTEWQATADTNVVVIVTLRGYPRVNGYRLGAAANVLAAPADWDVYVRRADPTGFMLVDRRRGEKIVRANDRWTTFDHTLSTNYLFSVSSRPMSPLAPNTQIDLAGTSFKQMCVANSEPLLVGPVVGTGGIQIENGSTFAPADLTRWRGTWSFLDCQSLYDRATIQLTTARGGAAEQPLRLTATTANVTVENVGAEPMSVLLDDDAPAESMRGRLADGMAPLGLIKRGTGTRTLATGDSANTGATVVEAGCLKVCGAFGPERPASCRYLRIWPQRNNKGNDSNGFNWGMNDFQLLDADGNVVAFPNGTEVTAENGFHETSVAANLIDGNISTRTLVMNTSEEKTTKKGYCSWVVIDMKTAVSFTGYRWYTAHGNSADQNRVPIEWTIETSDDGITWTVLTRQTEAYTLDYGSGNNGFPRGPYALTGDGGATSLATIPSAFFAGTTPRSTHAPALKARYFKFQPHETYDMNAGDTAYGWMISEFALFRDGERVDWPTGTTPTLFGGGLNTNNGSKLENICDNVTTGGGDGNSIHRVFVTRMPTFVTIDAGEEVAFDAYGFYSAAAGGVLERIPTAWTVSISADGTSWTVIDARAGERNIKANSYALQGIWSIANRYPLLADSAATDAIGDASPVSIHAGASLSVDSYYERFGTLSGEGTLTLCRDAVAEVNVCTDGIFGGSVTGVGTLAVCGVATQTFENTVIDVAKMELNGGTVTGTASRTGNFALTFSGGVWGGTLDVSGALTVSGTPTFVLPEMGANGCRQTLFTYSSIDAASAAVLTGAEIRGALPQGIKAKVHVGATACVLTAAADGSVILLR
ncbi:MAG: autotransporter-associated beta strand repeat-containing protein, partial [Kiritimatiellia bacterium]